MAMARGFWPNWNAMYARIYIRAIFAVVVMLLLLLAAANIYRCIVCNQIVTHKCQALLPPPSICFKCECDENQIENAVLERTHYLLKYRMFTHSTHTHSLSGRDSVVDGMAAIHCIIYYTKNEWRAARGRCERCAIFGPACAKNKTINLIISFGLICSVCVCVCESISSLVRRTRIKCETALELKYLEMTSPLPQFAHTRIQTDTRNAELDCDCANKSVRDSGVWRIQWPKIKQNERWKWQLCCGEVMVAVTRVGKRLKAILLFDVDDDDDYFKRITFANK